MKQELKEGLVLLQKKRYAEAEAFFLQATQDKLLRAEALEYLVNIAQIQKDFNLKLKRLDQLLAISPDNLVAELTRAKLQAMKGSLVEFQITITRIMARMKERLLPSALAGKKLLMCIQFAFAGSQRLSYLLKLLDHINQSIEESKEPAITFQLLRAEIYFALNDLAKFVNAVEQLKAKDPLPPVFNKLLRLAEKYKSPAFPDYRANKVFGIGLSRTGTESLNHALETLGFQSIHWLNMHTQNLISENDFVFFDGFTDISVSYQFEKLYHTFPNARFILTTRPMESWGRSIKAHYQNSRNISSIKELSLANNAQRFEGAAYAAEWNLYAQHPTWEAAFQCFNDRVEHFFANKPKSKFLKLRVCDGEGWEKLCPFLEKPIPKIPFPHTNHSPAHYQNKSGS